MKALNFKGNRTSFWELGGWEQFEYKSWVNLRQPHPYFHQGRQNRHRYPLLMYQLMQMSWRLASVESEIVDTNFPTSTRSSPTPGPSSSRPPLMWSLQMVRSSISFVWMKLRWQHFYWCPCCERIHSGLGNFGLKKSIPWVRCTSLWQCFLKSNLYFIQIFIF